MKLFLAVLTIWSLPLFGMSCGSANLPGPQQNTKSETIILTNQKPAGSFPLQPELFKNIPTTAEVPPVLQTVQVTVTKVLNPDAKPVTIFVYFSRPNEKHDGPPEKISVGNFSLYPADRPGRFTLNPTAALRKASEASNEANIKEWRLVFELEQKPEQSSSPLEVTIETPLWMTTKG